MVASGNSSCIDAPTSASYSVSTTVSDVSSSSSGGCFNTNTVLDATITVPANAKVFAVWILEGTATGVSVIVTPQLQLDGSTSVSTCSFYLPAIANEKRSCTDFYLYTGLSAGSHTFKVRAQSNVAATFTAFRKLMVVVVP